MARGWTLVLAGMLVALAVAVSACGDDDAGNGSGSQADRAFLEAMVPHHESAIAMARVARRRAEHPQITELAAAIVAAQSREIRQLEQIHRRLFGEPLLANEDAHEALGLSAEEAGMGHMESVADLKRADPFDKAFIDEMVPHHQGAIRMARAVQDQTEDDEIRSLADAIDAAQSKEIAQMNRWREAWYGAPSPAGTLPPDTGSDDEPMGGHEGH
jgi:uncharacterized protein (DUF305 family)